MRWIKKMLFLFLCATQVATYAQNKSENLPANWHNLDLEKDGFLGISTEKAYTELLKNKPIKQKVVVAVIDSGTDIYHEDLKSVLWVNEKEIPNNGIDDDGNGYVDDVNGWNFIGSKNGNLAYENLELVRQLRILKPKYQATLNTTVLDSVKKEEFNKYKKMTSHYGEKYQEAYQTYGFLMMMNDIFEACKDENGSPNLENIKAYKTDDEAEMYIKNIIKKGVKEEGSFDKFYKTIKKAIKEYDRMLKYNLNFNYDERTRLVGDSILNSRQKIYGNNDVVGPNPEHGTHVSGIIAANRINEIGIKGIANNVSIMTIRVVPDGDERDKDVANGIRYAVDNGAKVINMSFGKAYGSDKTVVDEAVKYAAQKGVLLVHAAGNENQNNDIEDNFPNKYFESEEAIAYNKKHKKTIETFLMPFQKDLKNKNKEPQKIQLPKQTEVDSLKFKLPHADNWIEVGASTYKNAKKLKADFSNYGQYTVDVFAPGYRINSTVPNSKYEEFDGTSMASPVVTGLAALILSYYPQFTPAQVRDIVMKSVRKITQKVEYKNSKEENVMAYFNQLCVSGGVVNAYNALKLAETYSTSK